MRNVHVCVCVNTSNSVGKREIGVLTCSEAIERQQTPRIHSLKSILEWDVLTVVLNMKASVSVQSSSNSFIMKLTPNRLTIFFGWITFDL